MRKSFKRNVIVLLGICLFVPLAGHTEGSGLNREEKMVLNLRVGHGSAGFYLLESIRYSKEVESDLRKAAFQVREVDKSYAKSKGRPDDRYFERVVVKMQECQDKAKALTMEIEETYLVLKDSIKENLTGLPKD